MIPEGFLRELIAVSFVRRNHNIGNIMFLKECSRLQWVFVHLLYFFLPQRGIQPVVIQKGIRPADYGSAGQGTDFIVMTGIG